LHYQPVVEAQSGRTGGFEAVVGWRTSSGSLVGPGEFIPVAENMGAIHRVGIWALRNACGAVSELTIATGRAPVLALSLSARQLHAPDVVDHVRHALRESGCDPASLELQITEAAAVHEHDATAQKLRRLKELGVRLAIADLGTGFSSQPDLQHLPIDTLRIDHSFVGHVASSESASGIARSIVAVGRQFGLRVVAEGVETEEQLRELLRLGCDAVQGSLLAGPVPLRQVRAAVEAVQAAWHRHTNR
jgi:EAL domain-containing protein (putative c-di-GMP-specific phosphodiesterase class I)